MPAANRITLAALALAAALLAAGRLSSDAPQVQALETDASTSQQASSAQPLAAGSWQLTSLNLPSAWQATTGGNSGAPVVAVVDSGVTAGEPGLQGRVLPGYDFVNTDGDASDDNGHGTAIGEIVASTCPVCRILPVKVLGADHTGAWSTVVQGITWAADHGAQVINLSVGAPRVPDGIGAAIAYAVSKGIIVVAAAGNDGRNESFYPAMFPGVVSVAGVDQDASRYGWSNYGPWVTVEAPGCAPTNGAGDFCGTSAAAPFIAGIAGLVRSVVPSLTSGDFAAALRATSPAPRDSSTAAAGLPDAGRLFTALGVPTAPPAATIAPAVIGVPSVGRRLSASVGRWQSATRYSIQWQRSADGSRWQAVGSGTSYVPCARDVHDVFRVVVTAVNARGATSRASAATARVGRAGRPVHRQS